MTDKRIQEIQEYLDSRRDFWWKDIPAETYIEHVGELVQEVLYLKAKDDKTSYVGGLLKDIFGDDANIKTWSREEVEKYRDRMREIMDKRPCPGLLPRKRE